MVNSNITMAGDIKVSPARIYLKKGDFDGQHEKGTNE